MKFNSSTNSIAIMRLSRKAGAVAAHSQNHQHGPFLDGADCFIGFPKIPSSPFFYNPYIDFSRMARGTNPPFLEDFPKASIEFGHFPARFLIKHRRGRSHDINPRKNHPSCRLNHREMTIQLLVKSPCFFFWVKSRFQGRRYSICPKVLASLQRLPRCWRPLFYGEVQMGLKMACL